MIRTTRSIVVLASVLAWLPLLMPYVPVADDVPLAAAARAGVSEYARHWIVKEGVWRIAGDVVPSIAVAHPRAYGIATIAIHTAAMLAFFSVLRRLVGGELLPLLLTLVASVYPWGHGALLFASAFDTVVATALFWASVLLLARQGARRGQWPVFVAGCALALLACLMQESLSFAFLVSGCVVWIQAPRGADGTADTRPAQRWCGLGPALGTGTYVAAYLLLRPETSWKHPSLNPESLLSVPFYQYSNAFVFRPWLDSATRRLIFHGWTPGLGVAAVGLAIAIIVLLWRWDGGHGAVDASAMHALGAYAALLFVAASAIYAVAGGYSLDSRKKYPLVPLLLLLVGWAVREVGWRPSGRRFARAALALVTAVGVSTSWLVAGVWRHEVQRGEALVDFLASSHTRCSIRVQWDPDLYASWPTMSVVWGYRLDDDWLINPALAERGAPAIRTTSDPGALLLRVSDTGAVQIESAGAVR